MARESVLLLIGLGIVGLVALRFLLPDGPLTAVSSAQPSDTAAALASVAPPTSLPTGTPMIETLAPLPTASLAPPTEEPTPAPTPAPAATPTRRPAATPRPTPKPTATLAPAHLIVSVVSTTDGGGKATASSWTVTVNSAGTESPGSFTGSASGTNVAIAAERTYSVSVSGPDGYSEILSPDCSSSTGGLPSAGTTETCTITEDDIKPKITVYTVVENGGVGTQDPGDWMVTVTGTVVSPSRESPGTSSGLEFRFNANQPFSVAQVNLADAGYQEARTGTCESGGESPGAVLTCTFTFTYLVATQSVLQGPDALLIPLLLATGLRARRPWPTRARR